MPYSRLYDAVKSCGIDKLNTFDAFARVLVAMQRSSVSFQALVELLGPDVTLGELADLEGPVVADTVATPE